MHKAREVLRLALFCKSNRRDIADSCGIDPKTVDKYLQRVSESRLAYAELEKMSDTELEKILKSKRGRKDDKHGLQPDFQTIHNELKRKGVTRQLLWEEYIQQNPDGYRRTQFFHLYGKWKKRLNPSMRQTHKAGEKMFVDYSGQTIAVTDPKSGDLVQAEVFVAVLGASNYTYAEASSGQDLSNWINSHVKAMAFFEGVPAITVPDNLKSGVTKACRYDPDLNREYREMAVHYGTAVIPTRVAAPKDKSRAENGVLLVQRWILAALRNRQFFSLQELNQAVSELVGRLNSRPFNKLSGTRQELFESIDKPALNPLPQQPYVYANWKTTTAGKDYHVDLNEHYYSVPYQYADRKVEIRYTQRTVEVFCNNRRIASHLREDTPRESTTIKEHMPLSHQKYLQWTPQEISKCAHEIGPSVLGVVNRLVEERQHPAQAFRAAAGILHLAKQYSDGRLEAACRRALKIDGCSYKSIKSILKNGLDQKEIQTAGPIPLIHHQNIRGTNYYMNDEPIKQGEFKC